MKENHKKSPQRKPCASCPFLPMNHKEFGKVAAQLCAKNGQPKPNFWASLTIRENVKYDAIKHGKLQCHSSVYDAKMNAHPEASKPCVGLENHLKGLI